MTSSADQYCRTEIRDNMRITWHQPITVDDGLTLRAVGERLGVSRTALYRHFPDKASLLAAVKRLVAGRRSRVGIIIVAPVPVGLAVTALWHLGVAVPEQAEVVGEELYLNSNH